MTTTLVFTVLWAFALLQTSTPVVAVPSHQAVMAAGHGEPPPQLPNVYPPPQQITWSGSPVSLNGEVAIVTGNATDAATLDAVVLIVSSAGGQVAVSSEPTGKCTQILLGTAAENEAAASAAKALAGESTTGLAGDGYVLASGSYNGQPTIVLNGVDQWGTFYAAQTLRQVVTGTSVPGVKVRDWPLMSIRGSIEGFYGIPWSHQARLDQFTYYGKHKLNTYIYTPKNDDLLRAKWRTLYSGDALAELQELVDAANYNHVDFTFALSPGRDLCYSSDADFDATIAKFEQVRSLGVHSFYIALDDISLKLHCDSDKQKYTNPDRWIAAAQAQADYLNRIQREYVEPNGFDNLQTVPTEYAGSWPEPYKDEFGTRVDKKIRIQWTGEGVMSDKITVDSVTRASKSYVTDNLYVWDNFPVNDGRRDRLFLNPLTGRAPELYKYLIGFTSNPMIQPYASMPALANYADYTWNGPAYDPDASMAGALRELAGKDDDVHEALVAFADLNQNWPYRKDVVNAPMLSADISAFWSARNSKGCSANNNVHQHGNDTCPCCGKANGHSSGHGNDGTHALRKRLALLSTVPERLPKMAMTRFADDVAPWSTLAMQWAVACQHLISMLDALDAGDQPMADKEYNSAQHWIAKTKAKTVDDRNDKGQDLPNSVTPTIGDGAFDYFVGNATAVYEGR